MSNFPRLIALAVTLLAPLAAAAGPVDWTYTSTFHAVGQPNMPYIYVGDGGSGAGNSYNIEANIQGLMEYGLPSNPGVGSDVVVGHFEHATYNSAWQVVPTWEKNFQLDVTITDTASGEHGTAVFTGYADSAVTDSWPPNPIVLHLTSPATKRLTLGGSAYDVSITSEDATYGGNGDVVAHVVRGPESAPEPATIALAGVGLLGVFGVRRWKKG